MIRITIIIGIIAVILLGTGCSKKEHDLFASLHGVVSDHNTGEPVDNVSVVLSPGGKTKTTGMDGRFEFNDLDPQQYTITVQKAGYQTNRKTITAVIGEMTEVNIPLTKNQ